MTCDYYWWATSFNANSQETFTFFAGEKSIKSFEWYFSHPLCWYARLLLNSLIFCCTFGFNFSSSFIECNNFCSKNLKISLHLRMCNKLSSKEEMKTNLSQSFFLALRRWSIISVTRYCLRDQTNINEGERPSIQFDGKNKK